MTPFPIAVLPPQYQISTHRVEMQVLHFFPTDPRTGSPVGMEIWLGNLGPLSAHTVMPPTAPPGSMPPMFSPNPAVGGNGAYGTAYAQNGGPGVDAHFVRAPQANGGPVAGPSMLMGPGGGVEGVANGVAESGNPPLPGTGRHTSLDPPGTRRTTDPVVIISVEMPPMAAILGAIRELSSTPPNGVQVAAAPPAAGPSSSASPGAAAGGSNQYFVPPPPPPPGGINMAGAQGGMSGRAALPIMFVRPYDLVGYMTGYSIACENVFSGNGMGDPGLTNAQGWTLRVV